MKTLLSGVLAGGLALTTAGTALADGRHYWGPPSPPPVPYASVTVGAAGAIAVGAFLGYALGTLLAPRPVVAYPTYGYPQPPPVVYPQPTYYAAVTPHQAWCFNAYGLAYYPAVDEWVDIYGVVRRCAAPY